MNKKKIILSFATGLLLLSNIFANKAVAEIEPFDLNSVEYIEEEQDFELGFNTADYLPEGFDPFKMYVDLEAIVYIEEEIEIEDFSMYLPKGFDAYAYPINIESINYIDVNDRFTVDFDTKKHLPKQFNPYIK